PTQRNRPMVRPMNTPGIVPAAMPMRNRSTVAQVSPARSALRNRSTMVATTTVGAGRMRTSIQLSRAAISHATNKKNGLTIETRRSARDLNMTGLERGVGRQHFLAQRVPDLGARRDEVAVVAQLQRVARPR